MALGLTSVKDVRLEKGPFHYLIVIEIGLVEKDVVDLAVVLDAVVAVDAVVVVAVVVGMLVIAAVVAVKCASFGPKMQHVKYKYSCVQYKYDQKDTAQQHI